jgi:S-adenosylmethionine-dependent methyltransferase
MFLQIARRLLYPWPPRRLVARRRTPTAEGLAAFEATLKERLFPAACGDPNGPLDESADFENHRRRRLETDRQVFIPWLDSVRPLDGAKVLEIGCGSGSSTVALAEQGAHVVGLDVDEAALAVAHQRCAAYGVQAEFLCGNATQAPQLFARRSFDLILFFASLEHMTHRERLAALAGAWSMLAPGQCLGVVETPNRLWYLDNHTSLLPFFYWLPDDLALKYLRHSPRDALRKAYQDATEDRMLEFLRAGRGVSYHEFEMALEMTAAELPVASSLATQRRRLEVFRRLRFPRPLETRYHLLLREIHPQVHPGFLYPSLDLVLRKR